MSNVIQFIPWDNGDSAEACLEDLAGCKGIADPGYISLTSHQFIKHTYSFQKDWELIYLLMDCIEEYSKTPKLEILEDYAARINDRK